MMAITGIIIGKLTRTETTMYVLDLWPENLYSVLSIKSPLLRRLVESVSHWHYRHVDKIIALSENMSAKLIDITGISPGKITVLPQACEKIYETSIYDTELHKRFSSGFNIVFTGNISPAQSFETIIEAALLLKNEGIADINWIIVGDGMSRTWLEKEVEKIGMKSDFYFEGFKSIDDMPKYTELADTLIGCLVKSELLEATIPAKVMSYIASGKPIVLAMDGEVQDLINTKINCGFAGPAGDARILHDNIKKVYQLTSKQRAEMGKLAKEYHSRHFERNLILNKLYDFMFNTSKV
jgi:glycosyltransferase involved in cell wall biosynthesis